MRCRRIRVLQDARARGDEPRVARIVAQDGIECRGSRRELPSRALVVRHAHGVRDPQLAERSFLLRSQRCVALQAGKDLPDGGIVSGIEESGCQLEPCPARLPGTLRHRRSHQRHRAGTFAKPRPGDGDLRGELRLVAELALQSRQPLDGLIARSRRCRRQQARDLDLHFEPMAQGHDAGITRGRVDGGEHRQCPFVLVLRHQ